MKLWIDSQWPAPDGYVWCKTTNEAKTILTCVRRMHDIEITANLPIIEAVHIGDCNCDDTLYGGHFIEVLKFIEKNQWSFPIHFHGNDYTDINEMLTIARRNNWPAAI